MIDRAIKELMVIYDKVKDKKHIAKPVTYSLYAAARAMEKLEKRRDETEK